MALICAGPLMAAAPDRSPRPEARPLPGAAPVAAAPAPSPAPRPERPATAAPAAAAEAAVTVTRIAITASRLAPRASLRPDLRPGGPAASAAATVTAVAAVAPPVSVPPPQIERRGLFAGVSRPQGRAGALRAGGAGSTLAVARSVRPGFRPEGLERRVRAAATRTTPSRVAQPGRRGALCGSPGLVGEQLQQITGRISGCGIQQPVRLREVDGIVLSTPATVNCDTARALQTWVNDSARPAVGRLGGGLSSLRVVASYACRTRNSRPGARLSEHATGNAIDIAGIGLANGTELTVLNDWRGGRAGRVLRQMHRGACGPFGTVLGPNSDRFHRDHFHFDVATYRSGPYCR
jgi:hypothetical protein